MLDYQQDGSAENEQFVEGSSFTGNITCSESFYVEDGVCVPACDEWEEDSHQATVTLSVILLVISLLSLVGGACVMIGSIIRRENMFQLPSVFLVYLMIALLGLEFFNVVTHIDNLTARALFCSSRNLLVSINQSTIFCKINGAAFQYCSISMGVWWLLHIGWICYKLNFALLSRSKLNTTCVHLTLVTLGILLPLPGIIVVLSYEEYQYTPFRAPPVACISNDPNVAYYSFIFMLNIIAMAGVSMLLPILWTVHKFRRNKDAHLKPSTPELKLLAVLCYYVVLAIFGFLYDSVLSTNASVSVSYFQEYFRCESAGLPNNCSELRAEYTKYTYTYLLVLRDFSVSFVPYVNLIYVINWKKARQELLHCIRPFKEEANSKTTYQ